MRRDGHIRERSPGSFELRYSLGTDPATGKRRTAAITFRGGRKEAEKELRRLLHAVDIGEHVIDQKMTVAAWLSTWLGSVRPSLSPRSHRRYTEIVEHYLVSAIGRVQLIKLSPAHLQHAYAGWAEGGRRDGKAGGLSAISIRYNHTILRAALANAVEMQLIARNPADAVRRKLPKCHRSEALALASDQAERLLDAAGELYVPIMLALATGARRGEVLALKWSNVDLARGVIRVVESLEQTTAGVRAVRPKGGKSRSVTLPGEALDELRRHKREQAELLLRVGIRQSGETLVCSRADGSPLTPWILTSAFARLARSLDLPAHFHSLRHTHATELLAAGVHPKIAQERLGHASIRMTLDLYSHVTPSMQEDAAAKIGMTFRRKW
jgi:integrase